MQTFLLQFITSLAVQLVSLFGILFVLGTLLTIVQSQTHKIYFRTIGWKGILWTAWIGTPIHELSHAIMAKIFRHKLLSVRLFQPQKHSGKLGHVDHSYNTKSYYQRMGNFFIGAAPFIGGSLFLFLCLKFLLPEINLFYLQLDITSVAVFGLSFTETLIRIFSPLHLTSWYFWLFIYLTFSVSSHMAPSPADRASMWRGFFWIVLLLIIINIFLLLFNVDTLFLVKQMSYIVGIVSALFVYALFMSLLHLLIAYLLLTPFRKY